MDLFQRPVRASACSENHQSVIATERRSTEAGGGALLKHRVDGDEVSSDQMEFRGLISGYGSAPAHLLGVALASKVEYMAFVRKLPHVVEESTVCWPMEGTRKAKTRSDEPFTFQQTFLSRWVGISSCVVADRWWSQNG